MGRYSQIRKMDISNGEGIGIAYFSQGCHFHCKNCFNRETWSFTDGKEFTEDTINTIIKLANKPSISRLSMLGGECLCDENINDSIKLACKFKEVYPNKKIWLWTGYLIENIPNKEIMKYVDYIIDGQFVEELKDFTLKFRGSKNQRVFKKVNNSEDIWQRIM